MHRCRSLLTLALLALAAAASGCRSLFSPADEGVALELDIEPRPLPEGDTARVTLTLRNGGSEQIRFERAGSTCLVTFHLADRVPREEQEEGQPCRSDIEFVAVSAQGSWSQTYRWIPRASEDDEEPLPPGWYQLVGHVHDDGTTLESEPVTFRVVPR